MTTMPVGPEMPGTLAGPAFEIVQPSFYVLPHRRAAWLILAHRLGELARRADHISEAAALAQLGEIGTQLHAVAHDIAAAQVEEEPL